METPPVRRSTRIKNDLSLGQSLVEKSSEPQFKASEQEVADGDVQFDPNVHASGVLSHGKRKSVSGSDCDEHKAASKKSVRSATKTKVHTKSNGKSYSLRSSENGAKVLRSESIVKEVPIKLACDNHEIPLREKKKRKKMKSDSRDEYAVIRNRLRYSLSRINCEQNLLDAYYAEGWRGQSLEKIRPEKELERAKSEILRCKLKIRELFHHLCSLLSDGRLEEPLFDSEGEISCDDIFCAKCHSKDLSIDNDIILCDGICDRGFHQKCLNPPLLNEDIPPGDEGWLCPGCNCKIDCIDLLNNEILGCHLEIEDTWEKVFPEASVITNEDQQYDSSGLPSDDSDGDYNPDILVSDAENEDEGSASEESVFASSSEELENSKNNENDVYFGLPSEDSEDDDYDPDKKEPDENIQKDESGSDESDFTSDSDEFIAEICQSSFPNDSSTSLLPESKPQPEPHGEEISTKDGNEPESNLDNILLVSKGKQPEHLDYKKKLLENFQANEFPDREKKKNLADELGLTVQQISRWFANARHNKRHSGNKEIGGIMVSPGRSFSRNKHPAGLQPPDKMLENTNQGGSDISAGATENTNQAGLETLDNSPTGSTDLLTKTIQPGVETPQSCSTNGELLTKIKSTNKEHLKEKLLEALSEKQYPNRQEKEELAKKLGITVKKVSKWFSNARHSMRHSAQECNIVNEVSTGINSSRAMSLAGTKNPNKKVEDDATMSSVKARESSLPGNGEVIENTSQASFLTSNTEPAGALKPGMIMPVIALEAVSADPTSPVEVAARNVESNSKDGAIIPHLPPGEVRRSADNLRPKSVVDTGRKRPSLTIPAMFQAKEAENKSSLAIDAERQKAIARELRRRKHR